MGGGGVALLLADVEPQKLRNTIRMHQSVAQKVVHSRLVVNRYFMPGTLDLAEEGEVWGHRGLSSFVT